MNPIKLLSVTLCAALASSTGRSQTASNKLFLKFLPQLKDSAVYYTARKPLSGLTLPGATLTVNEKPVKVYRTGAFGTLLDLKLGVNVFKMAVIRPADSTQKGSIPQHLDTVIKMVYKTYPPAAATKTFNIDAIKTFPDQNMDLVTGDVLKVRIKALTGCRALFWKNIPLAELPTTQTGGFKGIYQVNYVVQPSDTLKSQKLAFTLTNSIGKTVSALSTVVVGFNDSGYPKTGVVKGQLPYLNFGLGSDRLGGARLGYIDTLVRLKLVGKVGDQFKVALTDHQVAYIPDAFVEIMPTGTFFPSSLTGKISMTQDSLYDYVKLNLSERLPFSSDIITGPAKIIVDVYGATSNTNWIVQQAQLPAIRDVYYEQLEASLFRVTVNLQKEQSWGYSVSYEGKSTLVVKVKHMPKKLDLRHLTIAVDPGHGGSNYGTTGITGTKEKDFTLVMALALKQALESAGARVMLTRDADIELTMIDREKKIQKSAPDLLISIHANATDDPTIGGTSTYYRYVGFRELSLDVYNRLLETGLSGYGNIGRFNFPLNGQTDYPNVLVETAFLSNASDEANLLDTEFRKNLAQKIVDGVNDFLKASSKKNRMSKIGH